MIRRPGDVNQVSGNVTHDRRTQLQAGNAPANVDRRVALQQRNMNYAGMPQAVNSQVNFVPVGNPFFCTTNVHLANFSQQVLKVTGIDFRHGTLQTSDGTHWLINANDQHFLNILDQNPSYQVQISVQGNRYSVHIVEQRNFLVQNQGHQTPGFTVPGTNTRVQLSPGYDSTGGWVETKTPLGR